jgi:hypothetical protein
MCRQRGKGPLSGSYLIGTKISLAIGKRVEIFYRQIVSKQGISSLIGPELMLTLHDNRDGAPRIIHLMLA